MLQQLQELHAFAFLFMNLMGYVIIFSVLPCVMWVVISHFYVYRRGGLQGLVRWHETIRKYGFNDVSHSLGILGLGLLALIFCIPSPSDMITSFSTLLASIFFGVMAAFVRDRRKHWDIIKSSALEALLESASIER
jgi:hypothetical protein